MSVGKGRVEEWEKRRERSKLGLSFPETSGLAEAAACPTMELRNSITKPQLLIS